jgi:hypothetical protein
MRFRKEKSVEDTVTLGPTARATLVAIVYAKIFLMSLSIDGGLGSIDKNTKVKIEATTLSYYVNPLYGEKPKIIFDKKNKISWKSFWEKYGITPKRLKIGKEIEEEEVVALFGPCSCNGYNNYHNEDETLIARVKTLWMIMHQRT